MVSPSLCFGTAAAAPGHKAWGQLTISRGRKRVPMAVCVIHGAAPGEHVVLISNQHGIELNGIESLRRFCEQVDPRKLRGTIFAIPSANPTAAMLGKQTWTEGDRSVEEGKDYWTDYNLNRVWPGRKGGNMAERAVDAIWHQAILAPHRKANLVVDIHSHGRAASAIYAQDYAAADLGLATGIGQVIVTGDPGDVRVCNGICVRAGIMGLTIELAGQRMLYPRAIEDGRRALTNLLKFWQMLRGELELPRMATIHDPWRNDILKDRHFAHPSHANVEAAHDGLLLPKADNYDLVRKGEVVCEILDPYTARIVQQCRAPMSGSVYRYNDAGKAACQKGQLLFIIGVARQVRPAERVRKFKASDFHLPST